jgi:hypothetical protein
MADVMGRFEQGKYFAQQEQIHAQAMEENKLRTLMLKHQIDGMKIEDKLRQRAIEAQNFEMMQGQPEASQPATTSYNKRLPSTGSAGIQTGLPGLVSGMIQSRNAEAGTPSPAMAPPPSSIPAPNAQAAEPGYEATRTRTPMKISGVPEWGVPDTNIVPRSAEDIVRASIAQKLAEPRIIPRGGRLTVNGQTVAEGEAPAPTRLDLAAKAVAGDKTAKATLDTAFPPRAGATGRNTPRDVLLDGKPAQVLYDAQGNVTDLDHNPIRNAATRITRAPNQGSPTANRRADQADAAASRAEYADFYRQWKDRYPALSPTERLQQQQAKQFNADPKMKPENRIPELPEPPAAPSLPKWSVMTPEERQAVIQNPAARITDAEMTKRQKAAAAKPAAGETPAAETPKAKEKFSATQVAGFLKGQEPKTGRRKVTLTDGTVWIVHPDGQYEQVFEK